MTLSRRDVLKGFLAAGAGCAAGAGAWGFVHERHELGVTREQLSIAGLPSTLNDLRIGFISDIHRSRWVSHADVSVAVNRLMDEKPHLIVLGGDYVTYGDRQFVGPAAEALA